MFLIVFSQTVALSRVPTPRLLPISFIPTSPLSLSRLSELSRAYVQMHPWPPLPRVVYLEY